MEHRRRRNDVNLSPKKDRAFNNHQVVELVTLKVVLVVAREALGILFHMQMLRTVKMKVRGWVTAGCCRKMAKYWSNLKGLEPFMIASVVWHKE